MTTKNINPFIWLRKRVLPANADHTARQFERLNHRLDDLEALLQFGHCRIVPVRARQDEVLAVMRLLRPQRALGTTKVRIGSEHDGGYVMLDDFQGLDRALSFGVCDNDSWDLQVAERGIPVEQFDHSVEEAPSNHELLHFHKKKGHPLPWTRPGYIAGLAIAAFHGGGSGHLVEDRHRGRRVAGS